MGFEGNERLPYNDEIWVRNVQSTVNGLVTAHYTTPHRAAKIALIGHKKDQTGFYLTVSTVAQHQH